MLDLIILDKADCVNLQEVSKWDFILDIIELPCDSVMFNFYDKEFEKLSAFQSRHPEEYCKKINEEPEFEKDAMRIISKRRKLFRKVDEKYIRKKYSTHLYMLENAKYEYVTFNKYKVNAVPKLENGKINKIAIKENNTKISVNTFFEYIKQIKINSKIIYKNDFEIEFLELNSIETGIIMTLILKSKLNRGVQIL